MSHDAGLMIDAVCPVRWQHPLNKGLVSWWLGVPGWTGGRRLTDIAGGNHGTPNNYGAATWGGGLYGFRAVRLAQASSQSVTAAVGPRVSGLTAVTVALWVNAASYSGSFPILFEYGPDAVTTAGTFGCYYQSSTTSWRVTVRGGATAVQVDVAPPAVGVWSRVAFTLNVLATTNQITYWRDGARVTQSGTGTAGSFSSQNLYLGARAGSSLYFDCSMSDVRLVGRAWSDAEAAEDCRQARLGHPDTLRRVSPTTYFPTGAAPPPSDDYHVTRYAQADLHRAVGSGVY